MLTLSPQFPILQVDFPFSLSFSTPFLSFGFVLSQFFVCGGFWAGAVEFSPFSFNFYRVP